MFTTLNPTTEQELARRLEQRRREAELAATRRVRRPRRAARAA